MNKSPQKSPFSISLQELAQFLEAKLHLAPQASPTDTIKHLISLDQAHNPNNLHSCTFIAHQNHPQPSSLKVGAVLIKEPTPQISCSQIITSDPYLAFARCTKLFYRPPPTSAPQKSPQGYYYEEEVDIHPQAHIYPQVYLAHGAKVARGVTIHPGCYVGAGTTLGPHTTLLPQVTLLHGCHIGQNCLIHPGVSLGADGFGYATSAHGEAVKIYHLGKVVVEDDVEIGCSTNIHRATLGNTIISKGTKIDAQVQIAHNVKLGKHNRICAQSALAGSSSTGDYVILAPRCSLSNKIHVSDHIRVGALSAVSKKLQKPGDYFGFPAIPFKTWKRHHATLQRLIKKTLKKPTS